MYQLICEGPCNPLLVAVDLATTQARERTGSLIGPRHLPVVDDHVLALQRRLIYTPHQDAGERYAVCQACGTTRRYGS